MSNAQTSVGWGFDFGAIVDNFKNKVVEVAQDNIQKVTDEVQKNVDNVKKQVEEAATSTIDTVTTTA